MHLLRSLGGNLSSRDPRRCASEQALPGTDLLKSFVMLVGTAQFMPCDTPLQGFMLGGSPGSLQSLCSVCKRAAERRKGQGKEQRRSSVLQEKELKNPSTSLASAAGKGSVAHSSRSPPCLTPSGLSSREGKEGRVLFHVRVLGL